MKKIFLCVCALGFASFSGALFAGQGSGAGQSSSSSASGAGRRHSMVRQQSRKLNRVTARNRRRQYLAANPDLDPQTAACIEQGRTRDGMSGEQVSASLGTPESVNDVSATRQQWRYADGTCLDFDNKRLVGGSGSGKGRDS